MIRGRKQMTLPARGSKGPGSVGQVIGFIVMFVLSAISIVHQDIPFLKNLHFRPGHFLVVWTVALIAVVWWSLRD